MKNLFSVIIFFSIICIAQGQEYLKDITAHDCSYFLTDDSLFYYCKIDDGVSILKRNDEPKDPLSVSECDTSYRSFLYFCGDMLMIDTLFFTNYNEYAMDIEEITYYFLCENGEDYLLISFIDGKAFGTFVQPMYITLKRKKDRCFIQSTYILEDLEDGSIDIPNSVMVLFDNGVLHITGTNIKRIM